MTTPRLLHWIELLTSWIGSLSSIFLHTFIFAFALVLGAFHTLPWDSILLVLTTVVSLEAIYLAIFIQMTVNHSVASLREVEEDVDEIQKDIDAIEHDVDEIQEDEAREKLYDAQHQRTLQDISIRLQELVHDLQRAKTSTHQE